MTRSARFLLAGLAILVAVALPRAAMPQAIESGQWVKGSLATNYDQRIDVFYFYARTNDSVIIRAASGDPVYQNVPDYYLFDPLGTLLASQTDKWIRADAMLTNVALSGWYQLQCHLPRYLWTISNDFYYSVSMLRMVDYPLSYQDLDVGAILNGKSLTGEINAGADLDAAFFSITNPCTVLIRMGQKAVPLVPQLQLFDPNGRLIHSETPPEYRDEIIARITDPGIYTIVCNDFWNGLGPYAVTMVQVPGVLSDEDSDIGPIVPGETRVGTIDQPGDMDVATFSAVTGDVVRITMSDYSDADRALNPRMSLYNPDGELIQSGSDLYQTRVVITNEARTNGTFYIVCKDSEDRFGVRFSLTLEILSGPSVSNLPPVPLGISASDGTYSNYVLITWQAVDGANGYDLFRSYGTNEPIQLSTNMASTVYSDYAVETNILYYYKVRSRNYYGTSEFSSNDTGYAGTTFETAARKALVAGLNKYSYGPSPLNGCVADANGIRSTLLLADPKQRWQADAIHLVTDSAATKAAVRNMLNLLAATSGAGDLVLYFQSSHGGQTSGTDTYLCMYDANYTDAELASDLALFNTETKVVVIVDACHSGGLFKEAGWPFAEQVMKHLVRIKAAQYRARGLPVSAAIGNNIAFMTACDYNETSMEIGTNGVYTGFLLQGCSLKEVDTDGDGEYQFGELHEYAGAKAVDVNAGQHAQSFNSGLLNSTIARAVGSGILSSIRPEGDYDGDRVSDLAVYEPATGRWYVYSLARGILVWATQWGSPTAMPVTGDFNGDGKDDFAVYDLLTGKWYLLDTDGTLIGWAVQWGGSGLVPLTGDYNGDHRSDMVVYEPNDGYWYIRDLEGNVLTWGVSLAGAGYIALPGDYNRSGSTDFALFGVNNCYWMIFPTAGDSISSGILWGDKEFTPVMGDFDGDGACDLAVYDEKTGYWYIRTVSGTMLGWQVLWGAPGMMPVPGDFNGDGASDMAVYDTLTGDWYIKPLYGVQIVAWRLRWGGPDFIPVRPYCW